MIKFEQIPNKEHNSLWQIQQDDKIIYLNERDLNSLVSAIATIEKDVIETLPIVIGNVNELKAQVDELESILRREGIDY